MRQSLSGTSSGSPAGPAPLYWQRMRRHDFTEALQHEPVVVLPVGSIEQHGPHCPVNVDLSNASAIVELAAAKATDFPFIVAPAVPYGFTHYNQGFPGTITLQFETFVELISDICLAIHRNGFQRIITVNGHGGNHSLLKAVAARVSEHDLFMLALSHWDLMAEELRDWGDVDDRIGHAGEWETSLQLHLQPELVDMSRAVDETWVPPVSERFRSMVTFPERQRETPEGVMGAATAATAEKGKRYVEAAAAKLLELARDYRQQPVRRYRHWEADQA